MKQTNMLENMVIRSHPIVMRNSFKRRVPLRPLVSVKYVSKPVTSGRRSIPDVAKNQVKHYDSEYNRGIEFCEKIGIFQLSNNVRTYPSSSSIWQY